MQIQYDYSLEIVFSGRGRTKRFFPRRGVTLRRGGTLLQSMFTSAGVPAIGARFTTKALRSSQI